jgi:maltose/moltooligosaccharide transporter
MTRPLSRTVNMSPILMLTLGWFGVEMAMALDISEFQFLLEAEVKQATMIGAVLGIGPLAGITVQPAMGWLSDSMAQKGFSRDRMMQIGLAISVLSVLVLSLNLGLVSLIAMITLFFIGMNILMVSYRAAVTETSSRRSLLDKKGAISGFVALFSGAGIFIMLSLCGLMGKTVWPYVIAATALLGTFYVFFTFAPQPRKRGGQSDLQSEAIPSGLLKPANLLFYTLPILGLFSALERRFSADDVQRQIFRLFTVQFFSWVGIQALRGYFVLYAVNALHFTESEAKYLLAITILIVVAMAVPLGYMADKYDNRLLLKGSLLFFGLVAFTGFLLVHDQPSALMLCIMMGCSFAGLTVFPLSMLMKLCPPKSEGTYAGLYNLFISIPQLYSLMITGLMIDAYRDYHVILLIAGVSVFCGFLATFRLKSV